MTYTGHLDNKQILIDYEGNGANYHRQGDLGATIMMVAPRSPRQ